MNLHYNAPPSPPPSPSPPESPPPGPRHFPTVAGLLLTALGVTVMSGWLLRVPDMVEFRAGMVAMVFNTALCFTLSGLALALPGLLRRPLPQVQTAFGTLLTLIGGMLLFEHISDRALGIDWASLHLWLNDGNTRPAAPRRTRRSASCWWAPP